jgi:hypothetical protein
MTGMPYDCYTVRTVYRKNTDIWPACRAEMQNTIVSIQGSVTIRTTNVIKMAVRFITSIEISIITISIKSPKSLQPVVPVRREFGGSSLPRVRLETGGGEGVLAHVCPHQLSYLQPVDLTDGVHEEPLIHEVFQRVNGYIHTHIAG